MSNLDTLVLARAEELTKKWKGQGYLPTFAPHHFADLGLSDRPARVLLNRLVAEGRLTTHRDSRGRKTWRLPA